MQDRRGRRAKPGEGDARIDDQNRPRTAVWATSASQRVTSSNPLGLSESSSSRPNFGRPAQFRNASASLWVKRWGSSVSCAVSHATTSPAARNSRRHCASSEVLPNPAGASTRTICRRKSASALADRRGRIWKSCGARGGVTWRIKSPVASPASSDGWLTEKDKGFHKKQKLRLRYTPRLTSSQPVSAGATLSPLTAPRRRSEYHRRNEPAPARGYR